MKKEINSSIYETKICNNKGEIVEFLCSIGLSLNEIQSFILEIFIQFKPDSQIEFTYIPSNKPEQIPEQIWVTYLDDVAKPKTTK